MAARMTISFGTFLLIIFISRYLDVEGFGIYSTVLTFYATLEVFASLGFANYIPREVGRAPERTNEYLSHSIITAIGSALCLLTLSHVIAPHLGYNSITVAGIRIAILALIPASLTAISQSFLVAYEKAEYITFLSFMEVAARILASIYLLHIGYGVLSIVITFCLFRYISLCCYAFVLLRQIGRPRLMFNYDFFKHFIKDLATFSALIVVGGLFTTIESLALSLLRDETAVGIYNAGYRLVSIWSIIPCSIMNAALPNLSRLYRHSRSQFDALVEKSLKYLLLIAFPLIIGTTVVADEIVIALYGESFGETAIVLRFLVWSLLPLFLDDALWRILLASDHEAFTLRVTAINLLNMAVLCLLLIPPLSYVGASLVVILVLILEAGSYAVQVQMHVTKIRYRKIVIKPLLASLVMGLLAVALRSHLPLAAVISISALVYLVATILLGAVSFQELISLWKQIRPKASCEPDSEAGGAVR
jgi:O-antigen/teichoic acid export membrane protein